jgi:hypothetical protein
MQAMPDVNGPHLERGRLLVTQLGLWVMKTFELEPNV